MTHQHVSEHTWGWGRDNRERAKFDANAALPAWGVGPAAAARVVVNGVRGVELGNVALERAAGPTSVLNSTAIASSAAASAAIRSAGQRRPSARDTSENHVN